MARRASNPPDDRPLSRKYLSRAEREARQRQRVVIGFTTVAALVVLVLLGGALYSLYIEPGEPMAEVNGEAITRQEFYERVNYERFRVYEVIRDTRQQYIDSLDDPQSAAFMAQFFQQQLGQLSQFYSQIGAQTLETMIEDRIIEAEAERRGLSVSDEEVNTEIRRQLARNEGAQIEVDVTATAEAQVAATATAELFTPTPTTEATDALTDTESITSTATLTPTMTPAPTFTPAPTPTPYIFSDDAFNEAYRAFVEEMERRTGFSEADFRNVIRVDLLRQKVREDFIETVEVSPSEEQIHAAHILVETEEEAQQVIERLESGESFEELAAELSTDQSNAQDGGDLGWFPRGQMVTSFEDAAFALSEPGEISEPAQTTFGWHIIKLIEGPEERELPPAQIEQEKEQAFALFLQDAKSAADVRRYWDFSDLPSDPFVDELAQPLPTPPIMTQVPIEIEETPVLGEEELPELPAADE